MARPQFTFWQRLGRLMHYRLIIPIQRSQHPPEYTARGVMVGCFWAFTPLIGIQMYLVALTWLLAKLRPDYNFHPVVAVAWTWTTNVFTMIPIYYVFYITGQIMLGNFSSISGFDAFTEAWHSALMVDGIVQQLLSFIAAVFTTQGLPLAIGWVPWAIGLAWLGYKLSLAYVVRRRRARATRIARKRESRLAKLAARAMPRRRSRSDGTAEYDASPS